jgi:hypothetical protein
LFDSKKRKKRKRGMTRFLIPILLAGLIVSPVLGQAVQTTSAERERSVPTIGLVIGGSVGAVGGLLLGSLIGEGLQTCVSPASDGDSCGFSGFTLGAFVGSTVGSIVGAQFTGILFEDRPPVPATVFGGVLGIAGGLLASWALFEAGDVDEFPLYVSFSVSQGALTGIVAALRPGAGER